jgi:hypothetical protein
MVNRKSPVARETSLKSVEVVPQWLGAHFEGVDFDASSVALFEQTRGTLTDPQGLTTRLRFVENAEEHVLSSPYTASISLPFRGFTTRMV